MSTQQAIDSIRELARLRARVEALERTVQLGTVEFVLEDAIKRTAKPNVQRKRVLKKR